LSIPPVKSFDRVTSINLRSVWSCMKYELLQMRKQGSGAIVNNSSIGGLIGLPGRAIYHASKHGVIGLTKSAALEYAAKGIRINAICPGTIDTPMVQEMIAKDPAAMKEIMREQPIGRLGRAEEIRDDEPYNVYQSASPASTAGLGIRRLLYSTARTCK
jgi:NAD(P)-dependent dehydrogenase (short-subunit alcohol dehydrogenase family)